MLRRVHSIAGLAAACLIGFLAVTGALLSFEPAIDAWPATAIPSTGITVAYTAGAVAARFPDVERLVRSASGNLVAYHGSNGKQGADYVDPQTGVGLGPYERSAFFGFVTELHRSLFLKTGGRAIAGLGALALLILSISGLVMTAARLGGWLRLLVAARGTVGQRLHVDAGRAIVPALLLTTVTGLYMTLATFGIVPEGGGDLAAFPAGVYGGTPAPVARLAALRAVDLSSLRELVFPVEGDATDVFTITTDKGQGYIDQATGAMLSFQPNSTAQTVYETIYRLHTGQGLWWLGLLLGAAATAVPVMAVSGIVIWWKRWRAFPRLRRNVAAQGADTVILVGSEANATWGFAACLHEAMTQAGHRVHTATLNRFASSYPKAQRLFILTATYGDGTAPASANRFLDRLAKTDISRWPEFAVLGFGDRQFPHFCRFATDVQAALEARGAQSLQPLAMIDRQSSQAFAEWGDATGSHIGVPLTLRHAPQRPATFTLTLASRIDYGAAVGAPTAVLRFVAAPSTGRESHSPFARFKRSLPSCEAGDLIGIVPPGDASPRYYSLASGARDGFIEICVRKQAGGLCSGFLHDLQPGASIQAFVKANPQFRPARGRAPVIMIGAGTGIAPFLGFIRNNTGQRAMHLYWGGRDPKSDFLYADLLSWFQRDRRVTRRVTAFSRVSGGSYVQDSLREDANTVRALLARGAQILVCGGSDMAKAVQSTIDEITAPIGASVATLKAKGRYVEDSY